MENPKSEVGIYSKFVDAMNMTPIQFFILIILITVVNSPFVIQFEKTLLPLSLRVGEPPFTIIIFNALLIALIYAGINKLKGVCA